MNKIADLTVSGLLDALARPDPTPGGGTAAAVAGAIGASLAMMVAGLSRTRHNDENDRALLAAARVEILPLRDRLLVLADADAEAYDQVTSAFKLPKATDEEKTARKEAIQRALQAATLVPMDTVRAAVEAMAPAGAVARAGNPSAASDVGVAIGLLEAAATGAAANVRINLDGIQDETFRSRTLGELERLEATMADSVRIARTALSG
jgi:formiminotetrahydrofolate cyclodeaminase